MFRRTFSRRSSTSFAGGSFQQQTDKESSRMYQERRRRLLYDAEGNLQLGGLAMLLYDDFSKPFLYFAGGLLLFYGYNRLIFKLSKDHEAKEVELDRRSEELARQSGKVRSDRYLVKPSRQIDDPDFLNIPSHSGKGVFKSKLFEDDEASNFGAELKKS